MYLLDSNAIIITLKRLQEEAVRALDGKATLNLAYYEIGNIIWKECALAGLINPKEAVSRAIDLAQILEIMKIEEINSAEEMSEAIKIAVEQKLTFYDASYLQAAKNKGYILITEDRKLLKKSENIGIKAATVNQFLKEIGPQAGKSPSNRTLLRE